MIQIDTVFGNDFLGNFEVVLDRNGQERLTTERVKSTKQGLVATAEFDHVIDVAHHKLTAFAKVFSKRTPRSPRSPYDDIENIRKRRTRGLLSCLPKAWMKDQLRKHPSGYGSKKGYPKKPIG